MLSYGSVKNSARLGWTQAGQLFAQLGWGLRCRVVPPASSIFVESHRPSFASPESRGVFATHGSGGGSLPVVTQKPGQTYLSVPEGGSGRLF